MSPRLQTLGVTLDIVEDWATVVAGDAKIVKKKMSRDTESVIGAVARLTQ